MEKLIKIQKELKAPKGQFNSSGNYKYRSCEDILEAVKPLCVKEGLLLTISDEMVQIGDRVYVKATVTLADGDKSISVSAFAREALTKKGMDESQITGASSSYARKYALNGLFLIDDTKDADTQDNTQEVSYITKEQQNELRDLLIDAGIPEDKFLDHFQTVSIDKFPVKKLAQAKIAIDTTKNKKVKK